MLDDSKIIQQRDPQQALEVAANQWQQAAAKVEIYNAAHDHRKINNVVVAGMGGSALAALAGAGAGCEHRSVPHLRVAWLRWAQHSGDCK